MGFIRRGLEISTRCDSFTSWSPKRWANSNRALQFGKRATGFLTPYARRSSRTASKHQKRSTLHAPITLQQRKQRSEADILIFTLGLTETWEHIDTGTVYPTAPETVAGQFDARVFRFRNLTFQDCLDDYVELKSLLDWLNPDLRILLTVSPVPLTATASGQHVLTASTHSKAILRAVAGEITRLDMNADYFPAFELLTAPKIRGGHWFQPNLRSVNGDGVRRVMSVFLRAHDLSATSHQKGNRSEIFSEEASCDEILLEAFAP